MFEQDKIVFANNLDYDYYNETTNYFNEYFVFPFCFFCNLVQCEERTIHPI